MTVETKSFDKAEDLINFFQNSPIFKCNPENFYSSVLLGKHGYIFRGQSNADWLLIPSAFRSDAALREYWPQVWSLNDLEGDIKNYARYHLFSESAAVFRFMEQLEYIGLPNPISYPDGRKVHPVFDDKSEVIFEKRFPEESEEEQYALAQHSGVLTRFLDWSQSPFVACYFAAVSNSSVSNNLSHKQRYNNDLKMAVYWLDTRPLTKTDVKDLEIVRTSMFDNLFLQRQKGLFLNMPFANKFLLENRRWPSMEDYPEPLNLMRATLPVSEADNLMRELFHLDITTYSLMPTLENAAKSIWYRRQLFGASHK